jgi:hypothetical protein
MIMIDTFANTIPVMISPKNLSGGGIYLIYNKLSYSNNKQSQFCFSSFLPKLLGEREYPCIVSNTKEQIII